MPSANILLYVDAQFASPYAMSAFVALQEKGLPFEIATIDLAANANHEQHFAVTSITRRVPTLVHNSFGLSESSAISEYLNEAFSGTPLYPGELYSRARARQVQAWLRSDLMPIKQERTTEVVFYEPTKSHFLPRRRHPRRSYFPSRSYCFLPTLKTCLANGASPTSTSRLCSIALS